MYPCGLKKFGDMAQVFLGDLHLRENMVKNVEIFGKIFKLISKYILF